MTSKKEAKPDLISRRRALARIGLAAGTVYVAPVLMGANAAHASGASGGGGGRSGGSGPSGSSGPSRGNSGPSRGNRGSRGSRPSSGRNGNGFNPQSQINTLNRDITALLGRLFP